MNGEAAPAQRWHYRIYGLTLASNRPLRHLPPGSGDGESEIRVDLVGVEAPPPSPSHERVVLELATAGTLGPPCGSRVSTWDDPSGNHVSLYYFGKGNEVVFRINPTGDHIRVYWTAAVAIADVETLLFGNALGALLRLRGTACLHASALTRDARALAIVGRSGAGKSTTAAALTAHGFSVLADDIAPLREEGGGFSVLPAEPRLRLLPDAARAANLAADDAARVLGSAKRFAVAPATTAHGRTADATAVPLGAIYLLDRAAASDAEIRIEPIRGAAALVALTSQLYVRSRTVVGRDLAMISRLARRVPLRRVCRPRALDRLDELAQCIAADARCLAADAAASPSGSASATRSSTD